MIRTIHLHGEAGRRFGRVWTLDVETLAEAVRAIGVQAKGFREYIEARDWRCVRGDRKTGYALGDNQLTIQLGSATDLHITPVVRGRGAKGQGIGKIIAGVLLAGFAFFFAPAGFTAFGMTAKQIGMIGVGLALSGVSSLISAQKKTDDKQSHLFSSITDVAVQGSPVPILVGRFRCKGMPVISNFIQTTDQ
ncbi:putative Phage GP20-like protein [uncultured Pleomorphomonas sp.]|uniref:Putative Phage GP20-like protein n=1 Tax=uncultured Pleomorphomonas sp. TaxID=442121 RepID=A0A212L1S8_9HYPH|nr:tail assembly protein [uncultured Pleomorphomonas sp.]SCM71478.1 putative Phage GP20-like protein [uncultured Pleomorphomonas sp.]